MKRFVHWLARAIIFTVGATANMLLVLVAVIWFLQWVYIPPREYNAPRNFQPIVDAGGQTIGMTHDQGVICTFYHDGQYHESSSPHDLWSECVTNETDPDLNLSFMTAEPKEQPHERAGEARLSHLH